MTNAIRTITQHGRRPCSSVGAIATGFVAVALADKPKFFALPYLQEIDSNDEPVGRLSNEGLETELNEIQWLWKNHGVFALHADITSCVFHGDVLAFHSLDPLAIYVTESKKSGKFDRESPQGKRLQRLRQLTKHGGHSHGAAGHPLHLKRPGTRYATYHPRLRELLAEARESTYAWHEIDAGLALEV
jgi:hypothetical protein